MKKVIMLLLVLVFIGGVSFIWAKDKTDKKQNVFEAHKNEITATQNGATIVYDGERDKILGVSDIVFKGDIIIIDNEDVYEVVFVKYYLVSGEDKYLYPTSRYAYVRFTGKTQTKK